VWVFQTGWLCIPPSHENRRVAACGPVVWRGLRDNGTVGTQGLRGTKTVQDKGVAPGGATPVHTSPQRGLGKRKREELRIF